MVAVRKRREFRALMLFLSFAGELATDLGNSIRLRHEQRDD
jgi:hypothetical protein